MPLTTRATYHMSHPSSSKTYVSPKTSGRGLEDKLRLDISYPKQISIVIYAPSINYLVSLVYFNTNFGT